MTVTNTTDNDLKCIKQIFDSVVHTLNEMKLFEGLKCKWGKVSKDVEKTSSTTPPGTQYTDAVFYFRFRFNEDQSNHIIKKSTYDDVLGFHIMPYCITSEDIKNAVKSDSNNPFNTITKENYVDLEDTAFNFHKHFNKTQMRFQVVFVNNESGVYGPGKREPSDGTDFFDSDSLDYKMSFVKTDWYFPAIQESVETCDISGCLTDSGKENILEEKPIKRLEYLLAVDIICAMHTVLTDKAFHEYLAKIKIEELCELERETTAFVNPNQADTYF